MSCLDVMCPPNGHLAPYDTAASAFTFNSLQAPVGLRSSSPCGKVSRETGRMQKGADGDSGVAGAGTPYPQQAGRGVEDGPKEKQDAPEAEYLNPRCILFTYYRGDISSVVDEHFSRALSACVEGEGKRRGADTPTDAPSPSGRRSFPPSFWDSNYPAPANRGPCEGPVPAYSVDPYASALHPGLSQPHPSESWGYSQGQAYGPPRPLHELYGPAGLDAHYGPLLMSGVRPAHLSAIQAHYDVNKLDPASAWPGLLPPADFSQALGLNMEAGLQKGKEVYWF